MADNLTDLNPCPLCGGAEGYKPLEGSTFRWWQVVCAACGERVTECRSDPGVRWDRVPSSHPHADAAWQEATKHHAIVRTTARLLAEQVNTLSARVAALEAERDALQADAEDSAQVREQMRDILVRVAVALRGEPPPLTSWGWADLPAVGRRLRADALLGAAVRAMPVGGCLICNGATIIKREDAAIDAAIHATREADQ